MVNFDNSQYDWNNERTFFLWFGICITYIAKGVSCFFFTYRTMAVEGQPSKVKII